MNSQKNVNSHHLLYEARHWKKNNILYRLRTHRGMVIPMNIFDHRNLHHDLLEPPRPTQQQAEELLQHLGTYDSQAERTDYLDMAVNFVELSNPRFAQHLLLQRAYVLLTPFTQTEVDFIEQERAA